jgi:hypothetical protein
VSSPVQRRIAAQRLRGFGIGGLALGGFLIVTSALYLILVAEPSMTMGWGNVVFGAGWVSIGYFNFRNGKRQLTDLEREHGVGAGSDEELRSKHGL